MEWICLVCYILNDCKLFTVLTVADIISVILLMEWRQRINPEQVTSSTLHISTPYPCNLYAELCNMCMCVQMDRSANSSARVQLQRKMSAQLQPTNLAITRRSVVWRHWHTSNKHTSGTRPRNIWSALVFISPGSISGRHTGAQGL